MTLPCFAVRQYGCMDEEYQCSRKLRFQHYYLRLSLQVLEVHITLNKQPELTFFCNFVTSKGELIEKVLPLAMV